MMKKVSYMTWVGILAVLMGSCGLLGGDSDKPDVASTAAAPRTPAAKKAAAKSEPEPEPEPIVEPLPSAQNRDLIQPTNVETRLGEIERGRKDPFNVVSLPPLVEFPEDPPELPPDPPPTRAKGGPSREGNGGGPVLPPTPDPTPDLTREPIIFPTLPQMEPLPPIGRLPIGPAKAEIATGVTVSGVMELGGELQAIVTTPDEPTLRVKVGDRFASGAVRVKRIEINSGGLPEVILEENGYEVAIKLGEKPSSEERQ